MSAVAPELVERAHDVVVRLSAAVQAGSSGAYLQLICSELYEALRDEFNRAPMDDTARKELLSNALVLCKRSGDHALTAQLRLAQLRAIVALLESGAPHAPQAQGQPRFRVIQGGLA
jgi:hypothetical protein